MRTERLLSSADIDQTPGRPPGVCLSPGLPCVGDSVIIGVAGTSNPHAQSDLKRISVLLSAVLGDRVELAFAAIGDPTIPDAVAQARRRGARRVVVASYLLSDGLFQDRLRCSGADAVAEPLGTHPAMVRLIASRFRRARVPSHV